jgi:hypothetical protein
MPDWFAAPLSTSPPELATVGFMAESEIESGGISEELKSILSSGEASMFISRGTGVYLEAEFCAASLAACGLLRRSAILVAPIKNRFQRGCPVRFGASDIVSKLMSRVRNPW